MKYISFILSLIATLLPFVTAMAQEAISEDNNLFETLARSENEIDTKTHEDGSVSYLFNGSNSEIELQNVPYTRQFTFCAWIKPDDLLKKNMAIAGVPGLFWFRTTNTRELQFTQPAIADNNTDSLLLSNQNWYFVSLVIDYPKAKIYVDGQLIKEFTWQGEAFNWPGQLLIGKDKWQEHFNGEMKDISIYSRALSTAELTSYYAESKDFIELTDGIVFYHPMNKAKKFYSTSDLKPTGNLEFVEDSIRATVADFNGEDRFLSFGEVPVDNATTISLWIKPAVFNRDFGALVGLGHAYSLRINSAGDLLFTIPQEVDIVSINSHLKLNEWQHIAITYKEQSVLTFYVNGIRTQSFDVKPFKQTTKDLDIGINLWNDRYFGQMDDVIIWNRVLSDEEIKALGTKTQKDWDQHLSYGKKYWIYAILLAFLLVLIIGIRIQKSKQKAIIAPEEAYFKNQIRTVVLNHLSDSSFSVASFAEAMNMSKTKLYNTLKDEVGQAPKEYIRDVRLDEAARLLKETKLPINEVAMETGFESRAYFNKCFKSKFDFTPTDYRKE
ncbi:MAG: helix-turn-helix domain-containing protein [Carboxylicivirga sp.]|nr:helix-turn-helix domain-containing protein [Carboxylicivirga sp.]